MGIVQTLAPLALRQLIAGACDAVGFKAGDKVADAVVGFLVERFTDHSQRLTVALHAANDNAWKALEIALAGESLWDRCQAVIARSEDKAFGRQVRAFLDATPLAGLPSHGLEFRQACLQELRAARKAKLLTIGNLNPRQLAEQTGAFARFADSHALLEAEWRSVGNVAEELRRAGYPNLGRFVAMRPAEGLSLLVVATRYFFRRAVEDDPKLFQGLALAQLERFGKVQEQGFASLEAALAQRGDRLEELLGDVRVVVVETHAAVLDIQSQIQGQREEVRQTRQAVLKLLEQYQLQRRELRPGDSLSIRDDSERQLVKQLVGRYRSLPEADRKRVPALLNAIGKLEVVAGDFEAAQRDFEQVTTLTKDAGVQAEAHFNVYRAAVERREWDAALQAFLQATRLDAKRFAPFPVGKYHPERILGAGGFGVAFLCKHKYMEAHVVVKALTAEDLGRDADKVFTEAQVLRELDHSAIIRISDCGYVDSGSRSRPFLVMDYFEGMTLEEHVKQHGPLPANDLIAVARQVAAGLQAAHSKGILHRDVKPANLLVRKEKVGWRVKVIDFGLALRQSAERNTIVKGKPACTILATSIAGTLDYAAPEQLGRLREMSASPASDVYGFAKTCCFALFQTTQLLPKHWQSIPTLVAEVLERCLDEDPKKRPQGFAEIIRLLGGMVASPVMSAPQRAETAEEEAIQEPPKRRALPATARRRRPGWLLLIGAGIGWSQSPWWWFSWGESAGGRGLTPSRERRSLTLGTRGTYWW
jgi:tRNA A-37 threonylcarbamoyl transferase component Bud32